MKVKPERVSESRKLYCVGRISGWGREVDEENRDELCQQTPTTN